LGVFRSDNLAPGPGHVYAAAKLKKPFGDLRDALRMTFGGFALIKAPGVEKRTCRIEQVGPNHFRGPNRADPSQVAADRVEVIVRHEIPESSTSAALWDGNYWRALVFQPAQCRNCFAHYRLPASRSCDERLKKARRRWRPITGSVIPAVVKSH
jgi:hypothetical protein